MTPRCRWCRRPLHDPVSRAAGAGPVCRRAHQPAATRARVASRTATADDQLDHAGLAAAGQLALAWGLEPCADAEPSPAPRAARPYARDQRGLHRAVDTLPDIAHYEET